MINEQTISRFQEGDSKAYTSIYTEYKQKLVNFLQKHIEKENAEDIAQDTFLRLWDKRILIRPDKNLFGYICTIGLNIMLNERRHNAIAKTHLLKAITQANIERKSYSPEEEYIAQELLQRINFAIGKLTRRQFEIFDFIRNQGLTHKEIAQKLGIKASTIETHIRDINKIFHRYLGD
jgi:RNA polymerase sigma-70 factor (ECF subfamily)